MPKSSFAAHSLFFFPDEVLFWQQQNLINFYRLANWLKCSDYCYAFFLLMNLQVFESVEMKDSHECEGPEPESNARSDLLSCCLCLAAIDKR